MFSLIKKSIKKLHYKIPYKFRFIYDIFYSIYKKILNVSSAIYPIVIVIKENNNEETNDIVFAYVGGRLSEKQFWGEKIFPNGFQEHFLGKHFFWNVKSCLKNANFGCSFILSGSMFLTKLFSSPYFSFKIPHFMEMNLDLPPATEEFSKKLKAAFKDLQRRIRKHSLTCEISRDPEKFERFYHDMYVPYIKNRHSKTALIEEYDVAKDIFSRSDLFLIIKDNIPIAGHLLEYKKNSAIFHLLGIKDGDSKYLKYGISGVLDYFSILKLQKKGYKKTNKGGTRPFFNNGLTRYKLSFGAYVVKHSKVMNDCVSMILLDNINKTREFLKNNAFVFFNERNQISRALFIDPDQFNTIEELKDYLKYNNCDGIVQSYIFLFYENKKISSWLDSLAEQPFTIKLF